ncbi:hypothetical protein ACHAXT_001281 [Thalassiosira profunda]
MFPGMLRPSRRAHVHERVSQSEDGGDPNSDGVGHHSSGDDQSSGPSVVVLSDGGGTAALGGSEHHGLNEMEDVAIDGEGDASQPAVSASTHDNGRGASQEDDEEDDEEEEDVQPRHPFLSSQMHAEREMRLRRQSTCTLLILFFLIRLWIEAILEKDAGLIFLSMIGTTWTYRWFVTRREAEEEYDRQLIEQARNGEDNDIVDREGERTGRDAAVNFDPDLGLMSFQAQLALAILESQRQSIENGGYGGNERANHDGPGVTKEAQEKWKTYEWGECEVETQKLAGLSRTSSATNITRTGSGNDYGSVETADLTEDEGQAPSVSKLEAGLLSSFGDDEEPACSICLCEYDKGEKVTRLPCDHVFHEACLGSWTENHIRCPLCNCDLMDGFEQPASVQRQQRNAEEQRQFRHMALSTLGRRIRTRRSNGRRSRAQAAAALAAAEDSIV